MKHFIHASISSKRENYFITHTDYLISIVGRPGLHKLLCRSKLKLSIENQTNRTGSSDSLVNLMSCVVSVLDMFNMSVLDM